MQKFLNDIILFWYLNNLIKAILYASIAGFVQEFFKVVAAYCYNGDMFSGIAAGAGFGFIEAVYILGLAPAFTFVAILERLFAIIFHISSTALIMFGKTRGRFFTYYILISLVHTATDTLALLFRMGYFSLFLTELLAAIISTILFSIAILFYKRKISTAL